MAVWKIIQIIEMKLLLIMMLVWPHPQDIKTMTTLTRRLRQPQLLPPRLMMLWWSALVTEARSGFDQPYITTANRLKQFRKYSYFIFYITSLSFQYGYHSLTYWQWDISGFHYLCSNEEIFTSLICTENFATTYYHRRETEYTGNLYINQHPLSRIIFSTWQ